MKPKEWTAWGVFLDNGTLYSVNLTRKDARYDINDIGQGYIKKLRVRLYDEK